eukprot:TRINITY_DN8990_c0_g1_i2.p1 TRINITY_DN8990_c0_g1~~TRINITY_DN8990_c0_g1_i2.p1  ORF type:complete len:252 (-),score=58.15 TRINITY_DN8990_c0_g1_i2:314-1069(-)
MRSQTDALWPLLLEKAWIAFMGGKGYGDICANDQADFSSAARKRVSAHAGCVVQVLTGIMFDMHTVESRSAKDLWEDVSTAVSGGQPCFAGTLGDKYQHKYDQLEDEWHIKIFCNHCYIIADTREQGHERYFRLRNPHNRLANERNQDGDTCAEKLHKCGTLVAPPKIHRVGTVANLESALLHGQEFECTVAQFQEYFHTYEVSRRGVESSEALLERAKSMITFAGRSALDMPATQYDVQDMMEHDDDDDS